MNIFESGLSGLIAGLFIVIGVIIGCFLVYFVVSWWFETISLKDIILGMVLR
ncbi:hypothetical protein KY312_00275 [Candidatus Woesearchaeota archaeon]|nr:hypothetical protein [Candidatus Woesearchaeota archaeon]